VVEPSSPQAAAALLDLATRCDDPVLMLLPKHLFRIRLQRLPGGAFAFGKGMIRREGTDITIVAWGNCVPIALDAAALVARAEIDAEIIDLYSLAPCDWELLAQSVRKTGRLMVVSEDNRTCGFGQTVIAEIATREDVHSSLSAAPVLIARQDVHVPYHPRLERAILPQIKDVVEQAQRMVAPVEHYARSWNPHGARDRTTRQALRPFSKTSTSIRRIPVKILVLFLASWLKATSGT
jgi:2-oxoisovalerate dehydrogenase E1 component